MMFTQTKHDRLSILLHEAVRAKLLEDPSKVIGIGKSNLAKWAAIYGFKPAWMIEWVTILESGIEGIEPILRGKDQRSTMLRSSSPFAGVISQKERLRIIHAQREP